MRTHLALLTAVALFACNDAGPMDGTGGGGEPTGEVAKIELPENVIISIGQQTPFLPVALDPSGKVVGNVAFTYSGSDSSVLTVGDGVVTGLKEGFSFVTASYRGVTSDQAIVVVVEEFPDLGPSDTLIADALAMGTIDNDTAVLYRVYAAFGDTRLPLEYRGSDRPIDSSALDDAMAQWATLKEETQDRIKPFFVPAMYLGSWASLDRKPRAFLGVCNAPVFDPNWASYPPAGTGHVKVWYDLRNPTDHARAVAVSNEIEQKIWPTLTGTLGLTAPLSDGADEGCNGGDGRLDLILGTTHVGANGSPDLGDTDRNGTWPTKHTPVHLTLDRTLDDPTLFATIAHELTHACQWAYEPKGNFVSGYKFLREATAHAAMDFVYPGVNIEHFANPNPKPNETRLPQRAYLDAPAKPLNAPDPGREYAGYLFFQYMLKSGNTTFLDAVWKATSGQEQELKAIDAAVSGGLKKVWKKYARTVWNDDPVNKEGASFEQWDGLTERPKFAVVSGDLAGKSSVDITYPTDSENASVRFFKLTYSEVATRSLMFHNAWFEQSKNDGPMSVQAMWKDAAGAWHDEDWSDQEWIGFCRQKKAQRITELVIILGNANVDGGKQMAPDAPTMFENNLACWGLTGSITRETRDSSWTSGYSRVTVTADYEGATELDDPTQNYRRILMSGPMFKRGTAVFDENYSIDPCTYRANGTFALASIIEGGEVASGTYINYFAEPEALVSIAHDITSPRMRAYSGNGVSNRILMGTVSGHTVCPATYATGIREFLMTESAPMNTKLANADGSLVGSHVDADTAYSWSLTPKEEP